MDDKAWELLTGIIKDIKKDTKSIVDKQEGYENRFNKGNLRFQKHDNRIGILESDKKSRDSKEKGFIVWLVRLLTGMGLVGFGMWIKEIFGK